MKWVDRTGPPVLKRLPDLPALAQIPAPTQVPVLCGVPPLGGQVRGGKTKRHDAADWELPRAGGDQAAGIVATPVKVKETEESLVKSALTMEEDVMTHLTASMQRLGLRSPIDVHAAGEGERLQPPKLDLGQEAVPTGPTGGWSIARNLGHGEVSHDEERNIHARGADDSKETRRSSKQ
jgi:hypothetical protein